MSALHHGYIEAATTNAGRLVYTGKVEEHPLPGWPEPYSIDPNAVVFIPAQRRPADNVQAAPTGAAR